MRVIATMGLETPDFPIEGCPVAGQRDSIPLGPPRPAVALQLLRHPRRRVPCDCDRRPRPAILHHADVQIKFSRYSCRHKNVCSYSVYHVLVRV